jgi:two-component system OmpR family sensor kinase
MSRPRRLSLRTRMLVLLIGVTALVLVIMGAVSTIFLDSNLHKLADYNLAVATQNAESLQTITAGYVAVEVTFSPYRILPLSRPSASTTALVDFVRQLGPAYDLSHRGKLFDVPPAGHLPGLRGLSRFVSAARNPTGGPIMVVVARPVGALASQVRDFIIALLVTGGALIGLLAIGGEWLIGRGLDPLEKMTVTANEITSLGDLTARMPDASDETEIGSLGSAINTMLDRIQQAFGARQRSEQRVREFAADASHELRTPLTTIRGYAELYRQGALGPDQLPSAMRRIEQEAQRMSTLVAELLELARLDRISSLDLAETDLAGVVRDAVADAVAVEPERPVRAEAPPRLVAVVDERRIRQVLANLLGNVRAHTPVTTPAAVRLGEVSGGVLIEVADAGPGMSEQDAARAFDRFHRATEQAADQASDQAGHGDSTEPLAAGRSMQRSTGGGSGLGLSIVQAIAAAHGGQATLESWPGRGTRVRIWLPERAAQPA